MAGTPSLQSRSRLLCLGARYAIQRGGTAPPEIAIERGSGAGFFEVITEVAFEAADWGLGLRLRRGNPERGGIRGVEPRSRIPIDDPIRPTPRIAELRLERPAMNSPVDELGRVILSRGGDDLQTDSKNGLLFPFRKLLGLHGRGTHQIHREPGGEIEQPGSINRPLRSQHISAKSSHTVRQGGRKVRRPPEEVERMVEAEDRDVVCASCSCDRNRAVEIHSPAIERLGECYCIPMQRSDQVSPRGKILGAQPWHQ
jgi:hypothetical protein